MKLYFLKRILILFLIVTSTFFSFSQQYSVIISSIGVSVLDQKKFYFLDFKDSSDKDYSELLLSANARTLEYFLLKQGYHRLLDTLVTKPNYYIYVSYEISGPTQVQSTQIRPSVGFVNQESYDIPNINVQTSQNIKITQTSPNNYSVANQPNTITVNPVIPKNTPNLGINGTISSTSTELVYTRKLKLVCKGILDGQLKEIWMTRAVSSGYSNDSRQLLRVLSYSIYDYLGKDIGKDIEVSVNESSNRFKKFWLNQ